MTTLNTNKFKRQNAVLTLLAFLLLSASQLCASNPLRELNDELTSARLYHTAQKFQKASEIVYKAGKYTKRVGEKFSLVGTLDLDPHSGPIVQAVGGGLTISGIALQKGVSPILENHAFTLEDKALSRSAPLSISEAIVKRIDELANDRTRLNKKLVNAVKDTWYRKVSDKLRLSHHTKRLAKANAKYGQLLSDIDQKLDKLLELKKRVNNIAEYLNHKAALYPLTQQEEGLKVHNVNQLLLEVNITHKDIEYLLSHIKQAKNPQIYKDLIKIKESKLIRLWNIIERHF